MTQPLQYATGDTASPALRRARRSMLVWAFLAAIPALILGLWMAFEFALILSFRARLSLTTAAHVILYALVLASGILLLRHAPRASRGVTHSMPIARYASAAILVVGVLEITWRIYELTQYSYPLLPALLFHDLLMVFMPVAAAMVVHAAIRVGHAS